MSIKLQEEFGGFPVLLVLPVLRVVPVVPVLLVLPILPVLLVLLVLRIVPVLPVLIIMNCYLGLKNRLQVYLGVKLFLSKESLAVG